MRTRTGSRGSNEAPFSMSQGFLLGPLPSMTCVIEKATKQRDQPGLCRESPDRESEIRSHESGPQLMQTHQAPFTPLPSNDERGPDPSAIGKEKRPCAMSRRASSGSQSR